MRVRTADIGDPAAIVTAGGTDTLVLRTGLLEPHTVALLGTLLADAGIRAGVRPAHVVGPYLPVPTERATG